jgi:hypothetical protein
LYEKVPASHRTELVDSVLNACVVCCVDCCDVCCVCCVVDFPGLLPVLNIVVVGAVAGEGVSILTHSLAPLVDVIPKSHGKQDTDPGNEKVSSSHTSHKEEPLNAYVPPTHVIHSEEPI